MCAACQRIYQAAYRRSNAETIAAKEAQRRGTERHKQYFKDYREKKGRSYYREKAKLSYAKRGRSVTARRDSIRKTWDAAAMCRWAERRARKINATPKWADRKKILEIYERARLQSRATGMRFHVDHIVPLKSKTVCGLHVEHNLQVLPAHENQSKYNTHWPDMP